MYKNIKIRVDGSSNEVIQKHLLSAGCKWANGCNGEPRWVDEAEKYLYVDKVGLITHAHSREYFENDPRMEFVPIYSVKALVPVEGHTIEYGGKVYIKEQFERAIADLAEVYIGQTDS